MKIGVLGSSGGGAFAAFHDIVTAAEPNRHTFVAVSDRPCGFEDVCCARAIPLLRADGDDNDTVSRAAAEFIAVAGPPDVVLLYFLRLVTEAIYDRFATFNIHPSLLPAFSGFEPVARAHAAGVSTFGATLHQVDGGIDSGPIIAQIVTPVTPGMTVAEMEKCSYLHKVYCALLLVDLVERGVLTAGDGSSPSLGEGPLLDAFRDLQRAEGVEVVS